MVILSAAKPCAEEPDAGNLHVRIREGERAGTHDLRYSGTKAETPDTAKRRPTRTSLAPYSTNDLRQFFGRTDTDQGSVHAHETPLDVDQGFYR
jgi:hypothetical protein